jgi:hypothetical protein
MLLRYKWSKKWEVNGFGELMSGKSLAFRYKSHQLPDMRVVYFGYGPWRWYRGVTEVWGYTYKQGGLRGTVGKGMGGKETDGCPLTLPPLQKCSITVSEDHQEVARFTLVKEIELKMAALIWHAVLGYLQWNCTIFSFTCSCVYTSH